MLGKSRSLTLPLISKGTRNVYLGIATQPSNSRHPPSLSGLLLTPTAWNGMWTPRSILVLICHQLVVCFAIILVNLYVFFHAQFPRSMEINNAEVLDIHRAPSISMSHESIRNASIELESDSANAVSWCSASNCGLWILNFHLNFIRSSCKFGLKIKISPQISLFKFSSWCVG